MNDHILLSRTIQYEQYEPIKVEILLYRIPSESLDSLTERTILQLHTTLKAFIKSIQNS